MDGSEIVKLIFIVTSFLQVGQNSAAWEPSNKTIIFFRTILPCCVLSAIEGTALFSLNTTTYLKYKTATCFGYTV